MISLLDGAVLQIAGLNEREEYNFIKKHVRRYQEKEMAKGGATRDPERVAREATYRLFSAKPGTYGGGGVSFMIAASAWEGYPGSGRAVY